MDLYNNLNAAGMFLLKGLMTYRLLEIINLVLIGHLCIFGIKYGVEGSFIFSEIEVEKISFDFINC